MTPSDFMDYWGSIMSEAKIITRVGSIQVMAAGAIRFRLDRVLRMADHDEFMDRHHYQIMPGDKLDGRPAEVVRFATAHWAAAQAPMRSR